MHSHTTRWLALFLCTSAVVACGDDSVVGGSSSGGNNNGGSNEGGDTSVGAGSQGGDTNVGAGNQGGNGNGGNGNGGNATGGNGTGGTGEGGGVSAGADGASCVDDSECDGGLCLSEELTGFPGGMCTEDCTNAKACTAAGSSCVNLFNSGDLFCVRDCDPNTAGSCGPPAVLNCFDVDGAPLGGVCIGICDMNNDCTVAGNECQSEPEGYCAPPEDCDNTTDDDFDGDADCADTDCAALPACAAGSCAAPTSLADGVVANGTNVGATNVSDGSCAGGGGAETVFSYTSTVTGGLFVDMFSNGDLVVYIRSTCNDDMTELACEAGQGAAEVKSVSAPITAGQTVFIIVEGFSGGDADGFDIVAQAISEVCDDLIDADLDGSIDCADAPECNGTAACTPGSTPQNGTCAANTDCASTVGADPACLPPGIVNDFMCSEWCTITPNDCGAGRTCVDVGFDEGLCFGTCTTNANCPANFSCVDIGGTSDICLPNVPTAWTCDETFYNVDDGCDCGCGVTDPDCADESVGSCDFCDDPGSCSANACPGDIDPLDNSTCN